MMIQKNATSVNYNQWLKRLDTCLKKQVNNQNSIKVPKVVEPTSKKHLLKHFVD